MIGDEVSAVLDASAVVMNELTAQQTGAQVGDVMELRAEDGSTQAFRVAGIRPYAEVGGSDLVITTPAADRIGVRDDTRTVIWGIASRPALESALVANGLADRRNTRVARSWDQPDPDDTLSTPRTKQALGEPWYRVTGTDTIDMHPDWKARSLTNGRVVLNSSIPIRAQCNVAVVDDLSAALADVAAAGLGGAFDLGNTNTYGGCYNPRYSRTSGFLSRHAYAMALDANTVTNCQGCVPQMNCDVVRIFRRHGFAWGGNFRQPDGMHFEWVGEPRHQVVVSVEVLPEPGQQRQRGRSHGRRRWATRCSRPAWSGWRSRTARTDVCAEAVAWRRERSVRHRRWWPGRPAGRHLCRPVGRQGHGDRARRDRWRRPPVGLHPEQDDDRHRGSDELLAPDRRDGPRAVRAGDRDRGAEVADRGHQVAPPTQRHHAAREPGRPHGPRRRPLHQPEHGRRSTASPAASEIEFDAALVSTGSRPRIPDWCQPDGDRILTTRDCYPPKVIPQSITVIGSGVTGVEFVHMFESFGSKVTLVVSRQQVLPGKDPEVAAVLEEDFLQRGVKLLKGARAESIERDGDDGGVVIRCDDGRVVRTSHAVLAIGSVPNTDALDLAAAGVEVDAGGHIPISHHCATNQAHIYAAGDVSGKLPLSSVAAMQGRKVAEHVMGLHTVEHRHLDYDKAASAIFTEPEIADVGLAEAEAFAVGRKIRVTKVPFATTAKALINNDPRGFVKIISDPATGEVLGGSIVGRHAAELISVIALAVTASLRVSDIVESLLVHPALSEALAEAAE